MRAGDLRGALAVPLVGYVFLALLRVPVPWSAGVVVGVAASAVSLSAVAARRPVVWPFVPWGVAVGVALGGTLGVVPGSVGGAPLATGLLVGSPWAGLAWLLLWRRNLAATVANVPVTISVAAFGLAVSRSVAAAPTHGADAWVGAFRHVLAVQAGALSRSTGAGIPPSPLGNVGDVVFDVLGLLALLGLLLTLLLTSERLPQRAASASGGAELPTLALTWSEATSTFAARSVPPSAYLVAGVVSLLVALAGVLVFAGIAALRGVPSLAAVVAGVVLSLGVLGYLGYPSTWESWRVPETRAPARPLPARAAGPGTIEGPGAPVES